MRDEKEERKKQARSNKQTRQSNTAHVHVLLYLYLCSSGDAGLVGFLDTAVDILHHLLIFPGLSHWSRWKWVDLQLTCTCSVSCYCVCLRGLWLDELLHISVLSTFLKLVCYAHVFLYVQYVGLLATRTEHRENERYIVVYRW